MGFGATAGGILAGASFTTIGRSMGSATENRARWSQARNAK